MCYTLFFFYSSLIFWRTMRIDNRMINNSYIMWLLTINSHQNWRLLIIIGYWIFGNNDNPYFFVSSQPSFVAFFSTNQTQRMENLPFVIDFREENLHFWGGGPIAMFDYRRDLKGTWCVGLGTFRNWIVVFVDLFGEWPSTTSRWSSKYPPKYGFHQWRIYRNCFFMAKLWISGGFVWD